MAEMILPGVYITVKDEGLISVGGISVGNIGIVGTARTGEDNKVEILSSFADAKKKFDKPDVPVVPPAEGSTAPEYNLLKALELIFGNGARTVYAVKAATNDEAGYKPALAKLENKLVNIVLLAGKDVSSGLTKILKDHINTTTAIKRERIAIVGSDDSTEYSKIASKSNLSAVADDSGRVIYVGPGISLKKRDSETDTITEEILSGAYTAAAFAGLLSSLPVRTSPTNKLVNISDVAVEFNHGELENLVKGRVVAIENRDGYRVVKGITTSTNTAWAQITTRRIVDKATFGVRAACNPYIGKLNNDRVRGAMKATIDGFLTRMVEEESLTGYTLEVSATRAQEIAGQCMVTMAIQPTFSIDYIVVTMYLG